jgi:hypothetical protein
MASMRHHNNVVADFEQLVKLLPPPSAVASPLLPTAPRAPATNMDSQDIQDYFVGVSYPVHPCE